MYFAFSGAAAAPYCRFWDSNRFRTANRATLGSASAEPNSRLLPMNALASANQIKRVGRLAQKRALREVATYTCVPRSDRAQPLS